MRYGIRSVSMDDIARHLGISKKTIYQVYADKDELVFAVSRLHQDIWISHTQEISATAADAIEELLRFSVVLRQQLAEMNPSVMFDMYKFHRAAWDDFVDYKNKVMRARVRESILRGIGEGYFRGDIDAEILATLRVEQVEMAFNDNVFPHSHYKLDQVQLQLFDHFVFGLLTEKGRARYDSSRKEFSGDVKKIK